MASRSRALTFDLVSSCGRARRGIVHTTHGSYETPAFMPVGTQGTIKGLFPEQISELDCHMLLGNTYHLELHPGSKVLQRVGGLHKFMNWSESILTDSGGFQMVSLLALSQTTEEGVTFSSPRDGTEMLLTPEKSIEIQESIGSNIAMQLDDVIKTTTTGERVDEAMKRSCRWLDRCMSAHKRPGQSVFGIIQGGLDIDLREKCLEEMTRHDLDGFAIGGLSGGEEKPSFLKIVSLCSSRLPDNKPRYCMGVGYLDDIVLCVLAGVDMFDCVYPTRTARFGTALSRDRNLMLRHQEYEYDFQPIDSQCLCFACKNFSRSYIHNLITKVPSACHLLTIHNLFFYMTFMKEIRNAISDNRLLLFADKYFSDKYGTAVPSWISDFMCNIKAGKALPGPSE